jgi:hypothetical protein
MDRHACGLIDHLTQRLAPADNGIKASGPPLVGSEPLRLDSSFGGANLALERPAK